MGLADRSGVALLICWPADLAAPLASPAALLAADATSPAADLPLPVTSPAADFACALQT